MIEVSHLSYAYGNRKVLTDVGFKVNNGKIYGIYGSKGAGKSTLLALLAGALSLQSGKIRINGFDIAREPISAKRCIGYLPQDIHFYPSMTPYELLEFVAEVRAVRDDRRFLHIHELLELLELEELRDRPLSRLTPVQLRRLGLGQALVGAPEILLLDTPAEGLIASERREIYTCIREIAQKGKTVFLATATPAEITELCHEVCLLNNGILEAPAPVEELLTGESLLLRVRGSRPEIANLLSTAQKLLSCRILPAEHAGEDSTVSLRLRAAERGMAVRLTQLLTQAGYEVLQAEELPPTKAELALRKSAAGMTAGFTVPTQGEKEATE